MPSIATRTAPSIPILECSDSQLVYRFTRGQIANKGWNCIDCGVNVIKAGDFCMLHPDLWERELHLTWDDNMCIKCIEARLGRKLRSLFSGDFGSCPSVEGFPMSDILNDRLFSDFITLQSGELVDRNSPKGRAERKRVAGLARASK